MNTNDRPELFTRLTLLTIPVPPLLAESFGYTGEARWLDCYWTPYGDEVVWDDGRMDATGEWDAYLAFTQHPKVSLALQGYRLGSSETEARDMLIIDREEHKVYVAPRHVVAAFLDSQWPALPQLEALPMNADEFLAALSLSSWTEERVMVDEDEITRRIEAREQRVAEMMTWLDERGEQDAES